MSGCDILEFGDQVLFVGIHDYKNDMPHEVREIDIGALIPDKLILSL